jgi:hypothetical protein
MSRDIRMIKPKSQLYLYELNSILKLAFRPVIIAMNPDSIALLSLSPSLSPPHALFC